MILRGLFDTFMSTPSWSEHRIDADLTPPHESITADAIY